jgi:hypothetical protein
MPGLADGLNGFLRDRMAISFDLALNIRWKATRYAQLAGQTTHKR